MTEQDEEIAALRAELAKAERALGAEQFRIEAYARVATMIAKDSSIQWAKLLAIAETARGIAEFLDQKEGRGRHQ